MIKNFIESFSLSGAIILIFTGLTVFGICIQQERVWSTAFTALTTFVTGKHIGKKEQGNDGEQQ